MNMYFVFNALLCKGQILTRVKAATFEPKKNWDIGTTKIFTRPRWDLFLDRALFLFSCLFTCLSHLALLPSFSQRIEKSSKSSQKLIRFRWKLLGTLNFFTRIWHQLRGLPKKSFFMEILRHEHVKISKIRSNFRKTYPWEWFQAQKITIHDLFHKIYHSKTS